MSSAGGFRVRRCRCRACEPLPEPRSSPARSGIAGIGQNRQPAQTGDNLAQELEALAGKIGSCSRQAGDVTARSCQDSRRGRCRPDPAPSRTQSGSPMSPALLRGPAGVVVRMTSTLRRTNSAAISAKRSLRPSAQRNSIATVRPSIQPSSRSRCTKAAVYGLMLKPKPAQEPDGRQLSGLLRARRERPRSHRAAEQQDELAPFHAHPRSGGSIVSARTNALIVAETASRSLILSLTGTSEKLAVGGSLDAAAFAMAGLTFLQDLAMSFTPNAGAAAVTIPINIDLPQASGEFTMSDYDQSVLIKATLKELKLKGNLMLDLGDVVNNSKIDIAANDFKFSLSNALSIKPWLAGTKPGFGNLSVKLSNRVPLCLGAIWILMCGDRPMRAG